MSRNSSDPEMTRPKTDRRIARTQRSLHVALNGLILEKGYDATTIKDITARADIGRSTFYDHHAGKNGLLMHGLQHLRTALIEAQHAAEANEGDARLLGFSRTFFEHVNEYRDIYVALMRSESERPVTAALKKIVADVLAKELRQIGKMGSRTVPDAVLVRFAADAFFSVLNWWFAQGPRVTAGDADEIFRRLVLPGWTTAAG